TVASLPDSGSQSSRSQRTSIGSEILMYVPNYEVPNSPAPSREADCLNVNLGNLKVKHTDLSFLCELFLFSVSLGL
ncbi:hypothetical protein AVEN_238016-1, partial [Araneus ventricosus]